jgi:MFS family permease
MSVMAATEETQALVARRLTWILSLSMLVAMMDRNNVNLAALKMSGALGLSTTALGMGISLFYIAYLFATLPSNLLLVRFGARRWIARIMISWGLVCALSAFVWDARSFYAIRFLLGLAEAGFLPGVFLYLTSWVTAGRRGRMNSYFLLAIPVSGVVTAIVSGLILRFDGLFGLAGWQLIFVLEALPAIALGIVILFYLDDTPAEAAWLSAAQKVSLMTSLAAEDLAWRDAEGSTVRGTWFVLGALLRRPAIWVLLLGYFGLNFGLAASVWVPQILQGFSNSAYETSILTALPSAAAILMMLMFAWSSDLRTERRWHCFAAAALCAGGFGLAALATASLILSLAGLMIAVGGAFAALVVFWTLPPMLMSRAELPVGMGLVTTIGVIGGMASPALTGHLRDVTGSYSAALLVAAVLPLLGGAIIALGVRRTPPQRRRKPSLEGISVPRIIDLSISLDGEVHCDPPEKRSKLRQELSCRHEIEGLESFRKAAEDRF